MAIIRKMLTTTAAAAFLAACGGDDAPSRSASEKAASAEKPSPIDEGFRLKNAEPVDVDALFALLSPDAPPTYASSAFDESIGATVVNDLKFAGGVDGDGVIIERAEFYGVDLDAIDRISNEEPGENAPFENVFRKVRLLNVASDGYESDGEEAALSIGAVEFDQLSIRQGGFANNDNGAAAFGAFDLGGVYIKDLEFSAVTEDAPAIAFSGEDLRLVGVAGGKINGIVANNLTYDLSQNDESLANMMDAMGPQAALILNSPLRNLIAPSRQRTTIESIEWRGIDFSGLLKWVERDEEPPVTEKNLIDLGTLTMTNAESFIGDKRAALVEEATVTAAEFTWLVPSKFRADTNKATYDLTAYVPDAEEETLAVLRDLGLDNVKGDGYAEWVWNDKSGKADLVYVANSEGFADFSFDFGLSGLVLDDVAAAIDADDEEALAALGRFDGLSLKITDEKALDAVFAIAALQMGGTAEDLRLSTPALIRVSAAQMAMMNGRFESYIDALADFIAKGGTLEISAKPAEPIPFSALADGGSDPLALPDTLDLKVTHSE